MKEEINPFDIVSGKVVQSEHRTYWFETPGEHFKDENWIKNLRYNNNLPSIVDADGAQHWYKNGLQHRDNDLPSMIEADGARTWGINGKRHRLTGPAVIDSAGYEEYYIDGEWYTKDKWLVKRNLQKQ